MITEITTDSYLTYEPKPDDLTIVITKKPSKLKFEPTFTFYYDLVDYSQSPTELNEQKLIKFSYDKHRRQINKIIDEFQDQKSRIVVMSEYPDMEAMGIALGISESNKFRSKFTKQLLLKATSDFDFTGMLDYLDITSELYEYLRKKYKEDANKYTRYELLGRANFYELVDYAFNRKSKTPEQRIDVKAYLDYDENDPDSKKPE